MSDQYRTLEIREDPDETFRWILLEAARQDGGPQDRPVGYHKVLGVDLVRFMPLLTEAVEGKGKVSFASFPLFRLYASISEDETLALLLGERSPEIAGQARTAFPSAIFSGERILTEGQAFVERDWELIGLAVPGWVLLFSEDVGTVSQSLVQGATRAAFMPLEEEWIHLLGPEVEDPEILRLLFRFLLDSLPERQD